MLLFENKEHLQSYDAESSIQREMLALQFFWLTTPLK